MKPFCGSHYFQKKHEEGGFQSTMKVDEDGSFLKVYQKEFVKARCLNSHLEIWKASMNFSECCIISERSELWLCAGLVDD